MMKRKDFKSCFKKIDFYATDVSFRENGSESFGSIFGSINSLIIAMVVALYGINKYVIMSNYDDTKYYDYSVK